MNLTKRTDFFDNFNNLTSYVDNFNDLFNNINLNNINHSVSEDDKNYYIELDMPNIEKEKIKIEHRGNILDISYERDVKEEKKNRKFIFNSITYGKFVNSLALPKNAQLDDMKAKYDKGILEITIPKAKPTDDSKKICFIE